MKKRFEAFMEKRKVDIITAVLKLVDRVGVAGVTTKRIAREVGVVEGALYKHFNSKNEIFHRLLEVSAQQLHEKFKEMAGRGLDAATWLAEWFGFVISYLEDFPGIYRILFSDALYAEDRELFGKFKSITDDLRERAEAAMRAGMEQKLFRPDLDPGVAAIMFLGLVHISFTLWSIFDGRRRSLREVARPLFDEYMNSLRLRNEAVR